MALKNKDDPQDGPERKPGRKLAGSKLARRAGMVALTSLCGYGAFNAVAATATMQIFAKLIHAIEITISTSMNFGTLAMTLERSGKATIDPRVNKLYVANNSSLILAGGEPSAGRFLIKGADMPVAISVEDTIVKLTNGTATVSVTGFNLVSEEGGTKATITPQPPNFSATMAVGATINTREGQLSGSYVGTNKIFANYQ